MDKPLQEFKKIGHLIHLMVEREAKKSVALNLAQDHKVRYWAFYLIVKRREK